MLEKYFDLSACPIRKNPDIDCYPRASQRECWEALPEQTRMDLIAKGEEYLNYQYPALHAYNFYKLYSEDSRDPYKIPYYHRREVLTWLVMAECVEHRGRFLPDIINGIYLTCEETTWLDPAHALTDYAVNTSVKELLPNPESDMICLFSAATGLHLAWVYYLLREELDAFCPLICQTIRLVVDRKLLNPYSERNDYWWLTFGNNWNTDINNKIIRMATILVDDEDRLRKILEKTVWSVDCYFKEYPCDGGCEEGTSYWHANMAAEYLKWLKYATFGQVDPFGQEQLRNIAAYEWNMYVGDNNYVTVSDSHLDFTRERTEVLYEIGALSGLEPLKIMAAHRGLPRVTDAETTWTMDVLPRLFPEYDLAAELDKYSKIPLTFPKSFWYDSIQTAIWREKDTVGGLFFTLKGGHNEELHNHNDVGNFALYHNCQPVIIDAGIGEYTNTAFSPERYTIWAMNSKYHNVPWIGGVEQTAAREARAVDVTHTDNTVTMDLAPAYADPTILHWIRNVEYDREKNRLCFREAYEFTEEKDFCLHFLLRNPPDIRKNQIILEQNIVLAYQGLIAEHEEVAPLDPVMQAHWGQVFRLRLSGRGSAGILNYYLSPQEELL